MACTQMEVISQFLVENVNFELTLKFIIFLNFGRTFFF